MPLQWGAAGAAQISRLVRPPCVPTSHRVEDARATWRPPPPEVGGVPDNQRTVRCSLLCLRKATAYEAGERRRPPRYVLVATARATELVQYAYRCQSPLRRKITLTSAEDVKKGEGAEVGRETWPSWGWERCSFRKEGGDTWVVLSGLRLSDLSSTHVLLCEKTMSRCHVASCSSCRHATSALSTGRVPLGGSQMAQPPSAP